MKGLRKHLPELLCAAESWCCHTVFSQTGDTRQKFSLGSFTAHFRHFRVDMDQEAMGGFLSEILYSVLVPTWTGIKGTRLFIAKTR